MSEVEFRHRSGHLETTIDRRVVVLNATFRIKTPADERMIQQNESGEVLLCIETVRRFAQ